MLRQAPCIKNRMIVWIVPSGVLMHTNHISKERDGNAVSNQDISQPYILPGSLVTGMAFGYWQFIAYKYWATFSLSLSLPVSVLQ